jgi:branched-chain amino acid transport system permease protein
VNLPYSYSGFEVIATTVNLPRLIVLITTAVVAVSLFVFLRTKLGKAILASSQDQMLAELVGINCNRIAIITFAISASIGCIGGVLYILNHPLHPAAGLTLTVKGLTVMVLGGIGNVFGAFVGGLLLGLAESCASFFLGDIYRDLVVYSVLVSVLLIRPSGIFGTVEAS